MINYQSIFIVIFILFFPKSVLAEDLVVKSNFFANLSLFCGQSLTGKTLYPQDPAHSFANKVLIIHFASCEQSTIKVPFKVGNDNSRTWIFSLSEKGFSLKHDHRHSDGTPDELTMYGGWANQKGNQFTQYFAADSETKKMLPEASTNVWQVTIDPEKQTLIYALKRHEKPRYEAVFQLVKP